MIRPLTFNTLLLAIAMLLNISCEDDGPGTTPLLIQVDLAVNEEYEYDTKLSGDEEGATISTQANHYTISKVVRDESTNYSAVYNYKPELDFVGADEVELQLSSGSNGASPSTKIEFIRIRFKITD